MNRHDPLICFYKDGLSFYSEDFSHDQVVCENDEKALSLLLKKLLYNKNKTPTIIQLSYPYQNSITIDRFILYTFELISLASLANKRDIDLNFTPMVDKVSYRDQFYQVRDAIMRGDLYQMNLTFPFVAKCNDRSFDIFCHYLDQFQGDYFCLLPTVAQTTISFSPELFISLKDKTLMTRPIKGTVSKERGKEELLNCRKEAAELSMIVDLLRNDLNKVGNLDGSKVVHHRDFLNIGDIIHTYSQIECKTDWEISDILSSVFPGGSITGCPKISAMEHIERIESFPRGIYTGSAGWIYEDEALFNILIRSFSYKKSENKLYYHSGGGIVSDSSVDAEYEEVYLKAKKI